MNVIYPDISHHETVKDWDSVKKNAPFIIMKATQGTDFIDPTLKSVIKNCEYKGIPYWLYSYLERGNELEQTKFLVRTCRDLIGDYFVGYALDAEVNNIQSGVSDSLACLKKVSRKNMLYTMYSQYSSLKKAIKERGNDVAWWEARYGFDDGKYYRVFAPHKDVDLHQYTTRGKVQGIVGETDMNRLTGSLPESWFATPTYDILSKDVKGPGVSDPKFPPRGYFKYRDGMITLLNYQDEIKKVQKIVNFVLYSDKGVNELVADGEYGKKTKAAVTEVQKKLGVAADGKFGPKTLTAYHNFVIFS